MCEEKEKSLSKRTGEAKTNNKETAFVICAAGADDAVVSVTSFDSPMLNAYTVAYESQFINSTRELQQLYTKSANQC